VYILEDYYNNVEKEDIGNRLEKDGTATTTSQPASPYQVARENSLPPSAPPMKKEVDIKYKVLTLVPYKQGHRNRGNQQKHETRNSTVPIFS
jgi:hypothetical protein